MRGRGFVWEFLTKKQENLRMGREDFGEKMSLFGTKTEDLGGEMQ